MRPRWAESGERGHIVPFTTDTGVQDGSGLVTKPTAATFGSGSVQGCVGELSGW